MIRNIAFGFLILVFAGVAAQEKPVKNLDIYLCIGQSNMAGMSPIQALDKGTFTNTFLFNDKNEWEIATCDTQTLNRYSTVKKPHLQQLGASFVFAKKLEAQVKNPIGIVANARSGTQIEWWQKGYVGENDNNLYEEAVKRINEALNTQKGNLKAIIWHQGEGDNSSPRKELYMQRLKKLVADLRTDIGMPNVPFVAGEVGQWKGRGRGVNPVIRQISDSIPNTYWVTSNGLTSVNLPKNDPHFDTFSQRALGGRYADKVMEVVYKQSSVGVTFCNETDFRGRSVKLKAGNYTASWLEEIGISPSEITSVKVDKGYRIQFLYQDKVVHKLSQSENNFKNVAFDSVKINYIK